MTTHCLAGFDSQNFVGVNKIRVRTTVLPSRPTETESRKTPHQSVTVLDSPRPVRRVVCRSWEGYTREGYPIKHEGP